MHELLGWVWQFQGLSIWSNVGLETRLPGDADPQTKPTQNLVTVPTHLTLLGALGKTLLPSLTAHCSKVPFQQKQHQPQHVSTYPELLQLC